MERLTMPGSEQTEQGIKRADNGTSQFDELANYHEPSSVFANNSIATESHTQTEETKQNPTNQGKDQKPEEWNSGERCATTQWREWSQCFDCKGFRYRFRKLRYSEQYTRCQVQLVHKEDCRKAAVCSSIK